MLHFKKSLILILILAFIGAVFGLRAYAGVVGSTSQQNWRVYYDDGAEPSSPYAGENTGATLSNNSAIVRVRIDITRSGNSLALTNLGIQYSTDNTNFTNMGSGNAWNWADGKGTVGNTVTSFLLSSTTAKLTYVEGLSTPTVLVAHNEFDFAITPTANVSASTLYYFRFVIGSTSIVLASGKTHPQITTAAVGAPNYNQEHFRIYDDTGTTIDDAGALANEDTSYNVLFSNNFRIRFEVANTGGSTANIARRLQFQEDSGAWTTITTGTNNVRLYDSAKFADGDVTTSRLTAVGTFTAGQGKDTGSDVSSISLASGYYTEDEYSLKFQAAAIGHTYQFRITNAGTGLDVYTVIPSISPQNLTFNDAANGNWNDGATWGNASPGTEGVDYPGQNDNTVIDSNTVTLSATQSVWALTISGGTLTAGSNILNVYGNWSRTSGTFTCGTGAIDFYASGISKTITSGSQAFNNIAFDDSGGGLTWQLQDALTVNGTLTITSGILDTKSGSNYALTTGLLNIAASGTLTANASTITLTGTSGTLFTRAGTFTAGTSTVIMNPDATVTLTSGTVTFYNLSLTPTITQARAYTFGSGALTINGNFNINPTASTTLTLTVNMGAAITVAATKTTTITGTASGASILDTTSSNYALTTGLLNIAASGTLTANASTITLTGTSGTLFTRAGTFTAGTSTVIMNPDAAVTLTSGTVTFYNLSLTPTITQARAYTFGSGALTVNGDFTVNPSSASNVYTLAVNMGANITVAPTKLTTVQGPAILNTTVSNYSLSTGQIQLNGSSGMVTYGSSACSNCPPWAITIDSSNNIYVAGQIETNSGDWAVRKYTSGGILDTTWGSSGMVTYDSGFGSDYARAITIDSSNNIYVAGSIGTNSSDWAVRKYTDAGVLDTTWGSSGMVTYDSGGATADVANAITIDSSNNIYVAGRIGINGYDWAVRKYTSGGILDTTWGSSGMVTYDGNLSNSWDTAAAITIDSSNNIYVAGSLYATNNGSDWAVRKYTSAGVLDTTWGSSGMVTYDSGAVDYANAITIDSSNNIYVAGQIVVSGTLNWAVRKYTSAGALDTTWGTGSSGMVTYDSGFGSDYARAITIDSSNNIYVAGSIGTNSSDWAVRKYTDAGVLDTTWGSSGMVTYNLTITDYAYAITIDSSNNIYVAGNSYISSPNNYEWAVRKYTSGGVLDAGFGSGFIANGSTVTLTGASGTLFTITSGSFSSGTSTVVMSANATATLTSGDTTFYNLTINAPNTASLPASATQTILNTFSCTGSAGNIITINSSSLGTQATLSKASGTVSCDYLSLKDSAATGGAIWHAGVHSTQISGVTGWLDFPSTYYWVAGSTNGVGDWSDSTHWATSTGGTGGAGVPGATDSAVFDANSGTGISTVDSSFAGTITNLTTSSYGGNITLAHALTTSANLTHGAGTINLAGNALTVSGTFSVTGELQLTGDETITGTPTLDTNSTVTYTATSSSRAIKSWTYTNSTLKIDGSGGTFTLPADLTCAGITLATGTFDSNSHDITDSGNWVNSVGSSGFTARGGTVTLNGTNQTLTGSTIFNNFSKTDTTDNSTDVILTFDNTATQTIGGLLTLQGIDDNDRVNLVSDSPGTRWELTSNGTFAINYADTTDSDASGGSPITFTNTLGASQNNLNWSFDAALTTVVTPPSSHGGGGGFSPPLPRTPEGGYVFSITPNPTTNSFVTFHFVGGQDITRIQISDNPSFSLATYIDYVTSVTWTLQGGVGEKTLYARFCNQYARCGETTIAKVMYSPPIPSVENTSTGFIENIIPDFLKKKPLPEPKPEVEQPIVREVPPQSLEGDWKLLSNNLIYNFVLAPLPSDIAKLTAQFPELGDVFARLGIARISDLEKLKNTNINLPVIANKKNVPSEILVAEGGQGNITIGSSLVLTSGGKIQQKIEIIAGKPIVLSVKPESLAESIKGYLLFKRKQGKTAMEVSSNSLVASALLAHAPIAQISSEIPIIEQELLVHSFEYTDPDHDGIFTAEISAPVVEGEYEVLTVINYKDKEKGSKELRMITVVDPEGYVYKTNNGEETRISNVNVSIFSISNGTVSLWDASKYNQDNPQITDNTGKYSFLVPPGKYYITAEAKGYKSYKGDEFDAEEGAGVHFNILMTENGSWFKALVDWKMFIIIIFGIALLVNFINDRRLRKQLSIK